jgi:hypothetical protein
MEKLNLKGRYAQTSTNEVIILSGEIQVDDLNALEGEIYLNGQSQKLTLRGHILSEEGLTRLVFLQSPSAPGNSLVYDLRKMANGTISGEYKGELIALPGKIEYDQNPDSFLSNISVPSGIRDHAVIRLSQ